MKPENIVVSEISGDDSEFMKELVEKYGKTTAGISASVSNITSCAAVLASLAAPTGPSDPKNSSVLELTEMLIADVRNLAEIACIHSRTDIGIVAQLVSAFDKYRNKLRDEQVAAMKNVDDIMKKAK